jgi:hypothetical protein
MPLLYCCIASLPGLHAREHHHGLACRPGFVNLTDSSFPSLAADHRLPGAPHAGAPPARSAPHRGAAVRDVQVGGWVGWKEGIGRRRSRREGRTRGGWRGMNRLPLPQGSPWVRATGVGMPPCMPFPKPSHPFVLDTLARHPCLYASWRASTQLDGRAGALVPRPARRAAALHGRGRAAAPHARGVTRHGV